MSDEELLAELRRTLHERAASLRPGPGRLPGPETSGAQRGAVAPSGEAYDRDPTARLRVLRLDRRSRPTLVAAAVLAAAAGIAAAVALSVSGPTHSKLTFTTQQTAPAPIPTTLPTVPAVTTPVTTTPQASTATTPPAPTPVPSGFQALSVTFVSAATGWAVGQYPCGTSLCPALAATTDGGRTWSSRPAPSIPLGGSAGAATGSLTVRFADGFDGWITTSTQLWSTHDGGYHWNLLASPVGSDGRILDLEASAGIAYLVVLPGPGSSEAVYSTPAPSDSWTLAPIHLTVGAGPIPIARLILFGSTGWIVDVDRTTTGGARLEPGAGWQAWTPPCSTAKGPGLLAAASAANLVAVCEEGVWGTPDPGTRPNQDWLFRSTDGGTTFAPVASVPTSTAGTYSITAAPGPTTGQAGTIVLAGASGLVGSFDGGRTWTPVFGFPSGGAYAGIDFVGFTTATQGVAVLGTATSSTMVMTRDGGHTWVPVSF